MNNKITNYLCYFSDIVVERGRNAPKQQQVKEPVTPLLWRGAGGEVTSAQPYQVLET